MAIWAFPTAEFVASIVCKKSTLGESVTEYARRIDDPPRFFVQDSQPI